ncbi:Cysteine protease atg4, partial [Modicella reniformis]
MAHAGLTSIAKPTSHSESGNRVVTEPVHQTAAGSTTPAPNQGLPSQETSTPPHNTNKTTSVSRESVVASENNGNLKHQIATPQVVGITESNKVQEQQQQQQQPKPFSSVETPQTPQTDGQETTTAPSRLLGSRFSVNLSQNSERAADVAQDLKRNMVNMWHAWFPTPPAPTSTASTGDSGRSLSGTQSLTHHPHQGQRSTTAQRVNSSYTVGFNAGERALGNLPVSPESAFPGGSPDDFLIYGPTSSDMDSDFNKGNQTISSPRDTTTRVVHDAGDPIASRSSTCGPPSSTANGGPIYLMGKLYPSSPTQWADFQRDFTWGLIWCTYRHGYAPIRPSNFATDVGWGCMLRSGQGLLANALAVQFMGRDWNRPLPGDPNWDIYVRILSWFLDDMNAKFPFSVHRIALLGKQLGKNIGQWFGPSTTSQVIQALVHNFSGSGLNVYVTTDGVVYKDQVEETATQKNSRGFCNLLILATIRLGIDKLNPIYKDAIKATFEFPQTLGIAGGRPSSSYYFVGYQGNDLFYLDPHHSRCVVETKPLDTYTAEVRELNARPGMGSSIFTVGERAPDYDDDNGERLLSVSDEEDEDLELIL